MTKGLLRNIQLSQTVDYDMHMDIAAAVVTVQVGADQRLMPRKVGFYIFHADGLRLFTSQSTLVFVGRIPLMKRLKLSVRPKQK